MCDVPHDWVLMTSEEERSGEGEHELGLELDSIKGDPMPQRGRLSLSEPYK